MTVEKVTQNGKPADKLVAVAYLAHGGGSPQPAEQGETAPPRSSPREQDWTTLKGYDRAVIDGWLVRFETDGDGHLVEIREEYIGNYGMTLKKWQKLRVPVKKRTGISTGNLKRVAAKIGKQHRVMVYLSKLNGHGARAGKIASSVGTSSAAAANYLYDLRTMGHTRYQWEREPLPNGGTRGYAVWYLEDSWPEFLRDGLCRIVGTKAMTPTDAGQLTGLGYEVAVATLAELHSAGRVGRVRTDIGYIYFTNTTKPGDV
jgi:hypothetical protein